MSFAEFAARKRHEAATAPLDPLRTLEDFPGRCGWRSIGNDWTRRLYDGWFRLAERPAPLPAVSLVFVRSHDGNTEALDPGDLGGGPVDQHVIYEGVSRVAAGAVMAGAKTATGPDVFFSVWHPELVELRNELGLPRHPIQVIVTAGRFDVEGTLACNVSEVPVVFITTPDGRGLLEPARARRPWMTILTMDDGTPRRPLEILRSEFGIVNVSAVGGRNTATSLIDAGLVDDLLLTTTERVAGEPDTPFYVGARGPSVDPLVRKRSTSPDHPFLFEHFAVRAPEFVNS
ncbi:MAG: hypothetical protein A3H96_21045 [Acidobacteria bacterium RIFCSPLOWO2_02_FULL_67_36]|nr:MAG: hypothetical protein A3H96_21045 [Acidobacteria bacterium RIFCSPLOWO2_02_FULL_67_36]OFW21920.1 MAG: hypothetical protein A3G21_08615 [Acidobacteria bacterium RIFCSPLOWO2_12_FULL_66_21]